MISDLCTFADLGTAYHEMPLQMAVEQPSSRVVCDVSWTEISHGAMLRR